MKTKRSLLNFLTDVIPLIIISFLGIFKLKLFIKYLGNDTLGLYQLFSQIMVYIALVDGGLTSAVLYSLYKPNHNKDDKKMSELLTASKRTFNLIGIAIFLIAFVVSFFIKFFIKDCDFSMSYLMIVFLLFSLSNIIAYFFVPYQVLLEVKEKKYISNLCLQCGQIALSILEIVMLIKGMSFISILLMHAIVKLISNILIACCAKKYCKNISFKAKNPDYSFSNQVKDLLVHKVNGLVGSNIDILIISKIMGLTSVAIYSIYNYIINMIKNILGKISSSIVAIIGNKKEENSEETYFIYEELNALLFLIAIILCVPLLLSINDFINIWYENKITTTSLIASSFVILLFFYIIKLSTTTFTTSFGLFKETKKCAILDMVVNLILSLGLVKFLGIGGVLLATAFSTFLAEYIMKTIILYKYAFKRSVKHYFVKNILYFVIAIIDFFLGYFIMRNFSINNIIMWFIIFSIYTIINSLFILIIFYLCGSLKSIDRFKKLFKRSK